MYSVIALKYRKLCLKGFSPFKVIFYIKENLSHDQKLLAMANVFPVDIFPMEKSLFPMEKWVLSWESEIQSLFLGIYI